MIDPATLIFIASTIKKAYDAGISIYDFVKEVESTGVIPQEAWDDLALQFDDAEQFWSSTPDEAPDDASLT